MNHFRNNYELTRKDHMAKNLKRFNNKKTRKSNTGAGAGAAGEVAAAGDNMGSSRGSCRGSRGRQGQGQLEQG